MALQRIKQLFVPLLRNRFVLIVTGFTIWMLFVDEDTFVDYYRNQQRINNLRTEQAELKQSIEHTNRKMKELQSSRENLEKFAREEYFMKKPNEVLFIIK